MKKRILNYLAKYIAKFYWGYLKKEIDSYIINIQASNFESFGQNIKFKGSVTIFHPENISIADNVQIGENIFLMGIGGIEIDEGTIISRNVCIHSGNHNFKDSDMIPFNSDYIKEKITIGKAVWIGQNVNILPGVKIGDGAIIGMGTTVSKDVQPYEIVVGMGQRCLGKRNIVNFHKGLNRGNYYGKFY